MNPVKVNLEYGENWEKDALSSLESIENILADRVICQINIMRKSVYQGACRSQKTLCLHRIILCLCLRRI